MQQLLQRPSIQQVTADTYPWRQASVEHEHGTKLRSWTDGMNGTRRNSGKPSIFPAPNIGGHWRPLALLALQAGLPTKRAHNTKTPTDPSATAKNRPRPSITATGPMPQSHVQSGRRWRFVLASKTPREKRHVMINYSVDQDHPRGQMEAQVEGQSDAGESRWWRLAASLASPPPSERWTRLLQRRRLGLNRAVPAVWLQAPS